jgi:alpha-glucosidase (family GH31 glycosyl hydrolase)
MRASVFVSAVPLLVAVAGCFGPPDLEPVPPPEPPPPRATYTGPAEASIGSADVTVKLRLDRFGMRVESASGKVMLDTFDDDSMVTGDDALAYGALGATYHDTFIKPPLIEGWDHVEGTDSPWHHGSSVAAATMTGSSASIDLFDPADEGTTIHLDLTVDGAEVRVEATIPQLSDAAKGDAGAGIGPLNQMGQSFQLPADEHFFGLGERLVTVDHRGRHFECWTEEGGIGQGEHVAPGPNNPGPNGPGMTHVPIPFYLSTRGYGLYLETTFRTGFSLGAEDPALFRVYAEEPRLRYRVLVHEDPLETLAHYTSITGRAHLPAPWVFGPRRRVDHGTMVNGVPEAQALRDNDVPTTVLDDAAHFLPIGTQVGHEAEFAAYNANLHALGFKADGYYNSYVSVTNPATAALVAEGRAKGYFIKLDDGTEFDTAVISAGQQLVATIDLTNPDAVVWYQGLLQEALDLGYDGWMLDFGEYVPQRALMFDGRTGWEMHNAYPVLYEKTVFEYLQQVRGDDFMFFARSGGAGSQAFAPVIWSGDPAASYDDDKGLPAQVRSGINAGLSGIAFWGSDISGYACVNDPPPDKTLYLRWAEFGALSSDMHDENACAQKPADAPPKWTLWSDAETTKVYGDYARLHTRLFPYIYAAAREATLRGTPVMRHPILMHPTEPAAAAVDLEYYFGPSLYVAPVVRRDALTRTFWLPPGTWIDWWTMAPLAGGAMVTRDAPVNVLPLFLRSGGIVAMLDPAVDTLAPAEVASVVTLADVAGVYDVRAAIDAKTGSGHAELVDATVLEVSLGAGALALPAGVATAADEASLSSCSACGRIDALPGGATRVRVSTAGVNDAVQHAGALTLRHHAGGPLRVRWDVVVAP